MSLIWKCLRKYPEITANGVWSIVPQVNLFMEKIWILVKPYKSSPIFEKGF